jgi:hypothetical protein
MKIMQIILNVVQGEISISVKEDKKDKKRKPSITDMKKNRKLDDWM